MLMMSPKVRSRVVRRRSSVEGVGSPKGWVAGRVVVEDDDEAGADEEGRTEGDRRVECRIRTAIGRVG